MRRSEKEVIDQKEIEFAISKSRICRVAFSSDNMPYIVPMNFGYDENCIYFHCAHKGKKIDIIKKNCNVCFEIESENRLVINNEKICSSTEKFFSVIGFGKISIIDDVTDKIKGLNLVINQCTKDNVVHKFDDSSISRITVLKLKIERWTGKKSL